MERKQITVDRDGFPASYREQFPDAYGRDAMDADMLPVIVAF